MSLASCKNSQKQLGFTLLEIAVALLLIGLLLGGVLTVTTAFNSIGKSDQQQLQMLDIRAVMLTYLKVNKHLPCPDTDDDGHENRKTSASLEVCRQREGTLPYKDLGIDGRDAWGNFYYYRVNQRAESSTYINDVCQSSSVFGQSGNVTVTSSLGFCPNSQTYYCKNCSDACSTNCTYGSDTSIASKTAPPYVQMFTPPVGADLAGDSNNSHKNLWLQDLESGDEIENSLAFMIVSFGHNGLQTWSECNNAEAAERENCDSDIVFVEPDITSENKDYLSYLTFYEIKKALLEAGAFK